MVDLFSYFLFKRFLLLVANKKGPCEAIKWCSGKMKLPFDMDTTLCKLQQVYIWALDIYICSIGHMTRSIGHMTRSIGHMTRSIGHMTHSIGHTHQPSLHLCTYGSLSGSYCFCSSPKQLPDMDTTLHELSIMRSAHLYVNW